MVSAELDSFLDALCQASERCTHAHGRLDDVPVSLNDLLDHRFGAKGPGPTPVSVTCCIAYGNDHAFLEAALDSIARQSLPVTRTLVGVDNSSSQQTAVHCRSAPRTEYRHFAGSHGPFVIMEQLIREATSDFVLLLDSDDIAHQDRLAVLLATALSTGADLVGSACVNINEHGTNPTGVDVFPQKPRDALRRNMCHAALYPTILLRRSAFLGLGGFATFESFGMDSEFVVRAARHRSFRNVPLPLYLKRERSRALTRAGLTGEGSERRQRVIDFTCRRYEEIFHGSE